MIASGKLNLGDFDGLAVLAGAFLSVVALSIGFHAVRLVRMVRHQPTLGGQIERGIGAAVVLFVAALPASGAGVLFWQAHQGNFKSTNTTTPTTMVEVAGQLRVAGGPAPGIDKPIPGRIDVHRDSPTGEVVGTAEAADDGTFRLILAPGTYALVATSPRVILGRAGTPCGSVTTSLHEALVTVYCAIP